AVTGSRARLPAVPEARGARAGASRARGGEAPVACGNRGGGRLPRPARRLRTHARSAAGGDKDRRRLSRVAAPDVGGGAATGGGGGAFRPRALLRRPAARSAAG